MKLHLKLRFVLLALVISVAAGIAIIWRNTAFRHSADDQPDFEPAPLLISERSKHSLPWHLVSVLRDYPSSDDVESLSVEIEIIGDVPDASDFFIVPINARLNDQLFYFGATTNIQAMRARDREWVQLERTFVFSKWGENNALLVQPPPDGFFLASDHEGPHVSARAPFQWGAGRYTFRLQFLRSSLDSGRPVTWVAAYVRCHSVEEDYYVGSIRFLGRGLSFDGWASAFTEVFEGKNSRSTWPPTIPKVRVAVGDVRINNELLKPDEVVASYKGYVPACARALGRREQISNMRSLNDLFPNQPGAFFITVDNKTVRDSNSSETLFP
jgi:hypothetical protein